MKTALTYSVLAGVGVAVTSGREFAWTAGVVTLAALAAVVVAPRPLRGRLVPFALVLLLAAVVALGPIAARLLG